MGSFFEPGTAPGPPEARASVSHGGRSEGRAALRRSKRNRPWNHVVFRPCSTRAGLLTLSAAPKIAGRSRLGRAVKRAIFVRFRQAALRPGRRKRREAGFVISLDRAFQSILSLKCSRSRAERGSSLLSLSVKRRALTAKGSAPTQWAQFTCGVATRRAARRAVPVARGAYRHGQRSKLRLQA